MKQRNNQKKTDKTDKKPTCYTGVYRLERNHGKIISDGQSTADIVVQRRNAMGARDGDRVEFQIAGRRYAKGAYEGRIVKIFDQRSAFIAEKTLLPVKYGIEVPFKPNTIAETKRLGAVSGDSDRKNLTGCLCCTIDPVDARDFDDAVSLERRGDGWELGVHIADVSHFVRERTALDREALSRGLSVYLPWMVIPMLPPRLSEDLCSLVEGKERNTVTCFMRIGPNGGIENFDVFKSLIKSAKRLDYGAAQAMIDNATAADPALTAMLQSMAEVGALLKKRRLAQGSLDFDLPEVKVVMDADGFPCEVKPYPKYNTNGIIEEFMLCANQCVARRLEEMGNGALYRVHGEPEEKEVAQIHAFLKANGFAIDRFTGLGAYKNIIEAVRGTPHEKRINTMLLRSMPKAVYATRNIGHFGLAFKTYTHFTSPIRRYPDLLVHRMLFMDSNSIKTQKEWRNHLNRVAQQCSEAEERALKAERDGMSLAAAMYLSDKIGQIYDGTVTGIIESGIFVSLGGLQIDGMVHVSKLGDDYFNFSPANMTMTGERTNRCVRIGDRVRVAVATVNISLRRIDLTITEYLP
ncbi:MAG: hypothetical protein A2268_09950 [Candidatus Raymondbacteria bacterium RifOxyA12_full_50_37]|uniref:exoribonuclease II n=1 Tax=Candidatus Raymondbacteria bacterium RIFOXYD12_FULL_49_13 TaxID=1817890 RepID=A0A1F7F403_UNCRA|nr:MAG: hypothetical protein A2350_16230 [Candidatus Raymondbacteria bacterium RifOxyB12_full_50_8]OGJ90954.1 MAG: hypothetical protein A2268_09950 [Candidatus Raymondbacteria bacterium RifOxyA12_full_50_37]OGJ93840.1 MAG: hypothetical protein A2248_06350 [Candidatus Raymondbacteria bacterium RIFOXYA2_FULL_49_16]OGJ98293.1 MAG: hypothetical protein A2453_00825 [Candidatus Raymondbacteria bacterium RIFOXYC2_FULL_50_21]OGK01405.1 MAG: hypothetical protein A2519_14950 [Candidatus Raymondbacteria b